MRYVLVSKNLKHAYQSCLGLASSHYENFPVASFLLPKAIRLPVAAIYAFARCADDYADEGEMLPEERLEALQAMENKLHALGAEKRWTARKQRSLCPPYLCFCDTRSNASSGTSTFWTALAHTIHTHQLPLDPFLDLLKAFRQDVVRHRYANFSELLNYCQHSANPIGILLLKLAGQDTPQNVEWSNSICTALQLINFIQDIESDIRLRNRLYIPRDEMEAFGVSEVDFPLVPLDALERGGSMKALMQFQGERARDFLLKGQPLASCLPGRLGLELRLIIQGGKCMLEHLSRTDRLLFLRPKLTLWDWILITCRGLL